MWFPVYFGGYLVKIVYNSRTFHTYYDSLFSFSVTFANYGCPNDPEACNYYCKHHNGCHTGICEDHFLAFLAPHAPVSHHAVDKNKWRYTVKQLYIINFKNYIVNYAFNMEVRMC